MERFAFLYCIQLYALQTDTPSLFYQEQLSQAALRSTRSTLGHKAQENWRFKSEPAIVLHSALNTKCTVSTQACYFDLRGRAKWCWSILAEAIMKHWVFPGSRWVVLLGDIPRDRGWRAGLMRKQSSLPQMDASQKCPVAEYWFESFSNTL